MNDILTRLRSIQNDCVQYSLGSDIIGEAADEIQALQQERDQLRAEVKRLDVAVGEEICNRDHVEDHADRLADGISKALGVNIGEHSSSNCPWSNAFFAVDEFDLAAHEAELVERFVGGVINCIKVISPEILNTRIRFAPVN